MIEILQDREQSISFRMAKVLALAHDVQNRINARQIFEVDALLERYQREGADEKLKDKFECFCTVSADDLLVKKNALLNLLGELEVLDHAWPEQLAFWRRKISRKEGADLKWETELEQLMVYFIFTYFCGAVYDGDAFAKVKMSVVCTLILKELWNAEGQADSRNRIAWSFSRELEHSDWNLEKLEELLDE